MANHVELEIREYLNEGMSPADVLATLMQRLSDVTISQPELTAIMNFAIQSGLHHTVFEPFPYWFKKQRKIPWAHFIEILSANKVRPSKDVIFHTLTGAKQQKALRQLVLSYGWDKHSSEFKKLRQTFNDLRLHELEQKRQDLKEKLAYVRVNRMVDEEKNVLNKLITMFPNDSEAQQELDNFKERWARHVVNESRMAAREAEIIEQTVLDLTEDDIKYIQVLAADADKIAKNKPETAYDLSLLFVFMELPNQALQLLSHAPPSIAADWLRVDLLMACGRHIQCLEEINNLENKYCDDPETTFASTYARALALNELGQTDSAIELLQGIANIRPNYRSAITLLTEWAQGEAI